MLGAAGGWVVVGGGIKSSIVNEANDCSVVDVPVTTTAVVWRPAGKSVNVSPGEHRLITD